MIPQGFLENLLQLQLHDLIVFQKNPRAHKNKIGTPPPPPPNPRPKKGNFTDMVFPCRKNAFFPGVHKIGAAISGPRIADTNFTDTGIFRLFSNCK